MDAQTGGGNAERVLQLSKAFIAAGASATLLTLDLGLTRARREAFGAVKIVALPCLSRRFLVPAPMLSAVMQAVTQADVVHITSHWTVLNAITARAAWRLGKPYVVCPAGALPVFGRSRILKATYNALVGVRLIQKASGWIAITAAEREQFVPYAIEPSRITIIPNGIWIEEFSARSSVTNYRASLDIGNSPVILFVGRLNAIKGPDILLEAFGAAALRRCGAQLLFAGPDEGLRDGLSRRAAELGLTPQVHFLGYLAHAEKLAAYAAADVVVIPSRSEAMSLVALEAGACAKPIVITDRCGFDEVGHAGGGRVVPVQADAIGAALGELVDNAALRREMGGKLRQLVESQYTWPKAARRYLELFTSIQRQST